jgi:hypothetical protein
MKIVVIGGTSQLGSKVVTILKRNTPHTIKTAQDRNVDTVSHDCPSERVGITGDAGKPGSGGQGCSGKDCAHCSSCAAIARLTIADPEIHRPKEPIARGCDDPEARYCGIRLADLRLLPDYRSIRDAAPCAGWPASLPSPRET